MHKLSGHILPLSEVRNLETETEAKSWRNPTYWLTPPHGLLSLFFLYHPRPPVQRPGPSHINIDQGNAPTVLSTGKSYRDILIWVQMTQACVKLT